MLGEAFAAAFADVWAAITAILLYYSLNMGTSTTTAASAAQASASSVGDFKILLTLVAAVGLYAAVALVHGSFRQAEAEAAVAAGGGGNRRPSDLVGFISAAAGLLELFLFVDDVGALGLAAVRVLPAASIATFFLGMLLIILIHIRAGGEGGGGAIAGDAPVSLVTRMAFAAAAGLVCVMAIALCAKH